VRGKLQTKQGFASAFFNPFWEGKMAKIFNKNFFIGMGAGILITILIIIVGGYLLIWWYSSAKIPGGGKILENSLEAPPFPSGALADYDWTVKSLDGQNFNMAEAKGKVVFLNFWATWCPPCVAEMPSIQRLYEKIKDQKIMFVCISNEDPSKVSHFVREKGVTFPVYCLRGEPPAVFRTRGIPATFILSPDGKVAFRHVGGAKWDDEKSVVFLKDLM
jgi:thiol-disulfide isomerase/thioredoxin